MKQCSDEARREYVKLCLLFETCIASGGADFLSARARRNGQLKRCHTATSKKASEQTGRIADCCADGSWEEDYLYSLDVRSARALLSRSKVIGRKYPQCRGHR